MTEPALVNIDGAARGNPGPAAWAVVIAAPGQPVVEAAATMGTATNNVAEYTALVRGLEKAAEIGLQHLHIRSDSELLVKQMNGEYRVKHPDLQPLYHAANGLKAKFASVVITHVRREQNKRADELGNIALDAEAKKTKPATVAPSVKAPASDDKVREDAILCLAAAAKAWGANGGTNPAPMVIWQQLWALLEDANLLKPAKK